MKAIRLLSNNLTRTETANRMRRVVPGREAAAEILFEEGDFADLFEIVQYADSLEMKERAGRKILKHGKYPLLVAVHVATLRDKAWDMLCVQGIDSNQLIYLVAHYESIREKACVRLMEIGGTKELSTVVRWSPSLREDAALRLLSQNPTRSQLQRILEFAGGIPAVREKAKAQLTALGPPSKPTRRRCGRCTSIVKIESLSDGLCPMCAQISSIVKKTDEILGRTRA